MPVARHRKYPPPPIVEAPPELAALVERAAAPPSREQQRAMMEINAWLVEHRVRKYSVVIAGDHVMGTAEGCPRIGRRWSDYPRTSKRPLN